MSTVEEIEQAIEQLSPEEYQRLYSWFAERDWDKWDRQIEADAAAGRLDELVAKIDREIDAGHHTKL